MAGRNKRNVETFNKLFRNLTRRVSIDELRRRDDRGYSSKELAIQTPLTVSRFKLLAKETRKWYLKDIQGFSIWAKSWDEISERLAKSWRWSYSEKDEEARKLLEKELERLSEQYFREIGRFVGGHEGDAPEGGEASPEARVEAALEKRRAKVTNKMARNSLWAPGTLLEVSNFFAPKNIGWGQQTFFWAGWSFPIRDTDWNRVVSNYSAGKRFDNFDRITIPDDLEKLGMNAKVVGLVTDEHILSGETEEHQYSWIRLVRLLVGRQIWIMILHPTLDRSSLSKWVRVIKNSDSTNSFITKTITVKVESDLKRALKNDGKEGHEPLICKENTDHLRGRQPKKT